jgi:small subunit ribosomal protein S17
MENKEKIQKVRTGKVVSDKMNKTRVVLVERKVMHLQYGKVMKQSKNYKVHDEKNESKMGDMVKISECRPLSKEKRWRLVEILKKPQKGLNKKIELSEGSV